MPRYEVVDLRTGDVLHVDDDREGAIEAARGLVTAERTWDGLDVVEVDGAAKRRVTLHSHESGLRSLVADAHGRAYRSFRTLEEAQAALAAAVILEADYGGQILATCPASLVRCSEERLRRLAQELEALTWTNNGESSAVLFEPLPVGAGVAGGMGGGVLTDGVWVHEELRQLGLAAAVEAVLRGERDALPPLPGSAGDADGSQSHMGR